MRFRHDPTVVTEYKVSLPGADGAPEERIYRLRFSIRELYRAEQILNIKALKDDGVNKIIQTLTDGSLDKLLALFGIMAHRDRPKGIDFDELCAIAEANFDGMMRACYGVLNITLPKPEESSDPKAPETPVKPNGKKTAA